MGTIAASRGRLVARRRVAAGLSQEELARLCECSVRTIMRVESGRHGVTIQRIRNALHQHLGIPLRELANAQR
jgi:transcriptional regulator with XRE-family HTH domain